MTAEAAGTASDALEPPQCAISLAFPLVASGRLISAQVVGWHPIRSRGHLTPERIEDVAVVELVDEPPVGAAVARLVGAADSWGHPFRLLGRIHPDWQHHLRKVWELQSSRMMFTIFLKRLSTVP